MEVTREDQDKINRFSRLHQREISLEEELKSKHVCCPCLEVSYDAVLTFRDVQKEKEDLDDVSNELELADEEATVPEELVVT